MFDAFETGYVRIVSAEKQTIGAGFLVSNDLILTCAHVLRPKISVEAISEDVCFDFIFIAPEVWNVGKISFIDIDGSG